MKGLSLTQPWASLVASGAKTIETRSWRTNYRGLVAIHAALRFPKYAQYFATSQDASQALKAAGFGHFRELRVGVIVAVAELTRCIPTERVWFSLDGVDRWPTHPDDHLVVSREKAFGDYTAGRWAWVLANAVQLPQPMRCKGRLGLWDVPTEIEAQILEQMNRD